MNDDDLRCIRALIRGDQTALAELYDRHGPAMLAVGHRILSDRREAEDLLHDVFLEAWRAAKAFDPERGTVRSWLLIRMRSRALDRRRAQHRTREVLPLDGTTPERAVSPVAAEALGDRQRVRDAVAALPQDQRPVLEMAYFEGLTGSEIAEALGLPLGTVKSRLARAIKHLRIAIHPERSESKPSVSGGVP